MWERLKKACASVFFIIPKMVAIAGTSIFFIARVANSIKEGGSKHPLAITATIIAGSSNEYVFAKSKIPPILDRCDNRIRLPAHAGQVAQPRRYSCQNFMLYIIFLPITVVSAFFANASGYFFANNTLEFILGSNSTLLIDRDIRQHHLEPAIGIDLFFAGLLLFAYSTFAYNTWPNLKRLVARDFSVKCDKIFFFTLTATVLNLIAVGCGAFLTTRKGLATGVGRVIDEDNIDFVSKIYWDYIAPIAGTSVFTACASSLVTGTPALNKFLSDNYSADNALQERALQERGSLKKSLFIILCYSPTNDRNKKNAQIRFYIAGTITSIMEGISSAYAIYNAIQRFTGVSNDTAISLYWIPLWLFPGISSAWISQAISIFSAWNDVVAKQSTSYCSSRQPQYDQLDESGILTRRNQNGNTALTLEPDHRTTNGHHHTALKMNVPSAPPMSNTPIQQVAVATPPPSDILIEISGEVNQRDEAAPTSRCLSPCWARLFQEAPAKPADPRQKAIAEAARAQGWNDDIEFFKEKNRIMPS